LGSTQHPPGCERRVARGRPMPSGGGSRRRAGSPVVRGQPRKDGEQELEPRRRPSGSAAGSRSLLSGKRRGRRRKPIAFGRSGPDAWVAFGWIHLRPSRPSGWLGRGRGASFGRDRSHDAIDSSGALRGSAGTVAERGDLRVAGTDTGGHRPSGPKASIDAGARQSRNTLPSPRRSGHGDASGFTRTAKRPAGLGGAETRGSIGNVSTQNPWEHRAVRSGNAAWPQRTPRWNKALRSALRAAHRGNTRAVAQRTTRGHARPVKATASEGLPQGRTDEKGVVTDWSKAAGEEKASKGLRHRGWFHRTFGSTTFGSRKAERPTGKPETW